MKKSIYAIASAAATAVAAVFLLTLAGCDLMTGPDSGQSPAQDGKAVVSLSIAGTEARTVAPANAGLGDVTGWKLLGAKTGESQIPLTELFDDPTDVTLYLETGDWDFTLEGYKDAPGETLILEGTIKGQPISLTGPNALTFTVAPVLDGEGTVKITINLPVGHGITQAKVFKDGVELSPSITPSEDSVVYEKTDHEAGDYYYSFRLFKDDDLYGVVSELVKVRANLTSKGTYTLTAADLNLRYAITFHLNGGAFGGDYPDSYRSTDAAVTLPTPTRDGYDFVEWHDNVDLEKDPVTKIPQGSMEDKDFYAEWEIINYKINYYLYDGSNNAGNPATYTVVSPSFTLQDPTHSGSFRFNGWYNAADFKDAANTTITVGSTGERTFHAQWIPQYTVTFNTYGGSGQGTTTHDEGYKVYKPADPEKSGFKFLGWFDAEGGDTKYEAWPYTLNADMTFHAHWKKLHLVTFYPNGGSSAGGSAALDPQDVLEGDAVIEPGTMTKALDLENLPAAAGLYTGQTFGGWYTEDSYSTKWNFTTSVTTPLDLYALWTAPEDPSTGATGDNPLAKALNYIKGLPNLTEKTEYTIVLDGENEAYSMAGVSISSPNINKANAVITLVGKGDEPTEIILTGTGALFRVNNGELVLGSNITLKNIDSNSPALVVVTGSTATLTMKAGAAIMDNVIDSGRGVNINNGTFNMEGGKIFNNSGGVYVVSGGTFNMRDGEISDNSATYGGGVYADGGTFNMSGGKIFNNTVTYYGGGVYVTSGGTFNMSGGEISDNSTNDNGGGVYVYNNGKFEMSKGTISGNSAKRGGGVYVSGTGSFSKTGPIIIYGDDDGDPNNGVSTDNTAKDGNTYGHAVYHYNDQPGKYTSYYRDTPLNEGDEISTEASKLPANGTDYNWTKK